jgi:hypothetical protein
LIEVQKAAQPEIYNITPDEVLGELIKAVRNVGNYDKFYDGVPVSASARAERALSEVAWLTVTTLGGWSRTWELINTYDDNPSNVRSQITNMMQVAVSREKEARANDKRAFLDKLAEHHRLQRGNNPPSDPLLPE